MRSTLAEGPDVIYLMLDTSLVREPLRVFVAILDHKCLDAGARSFHASSSLGSPPHRVQPPWALIIPFVVIWILLLELALLARVGLSARSVAPVINHGMVAADEIRQSTIGPAISLQPSDRLFSLLWITIGHTTAYHEKGARRPRAFENPWYD